MDVDVDIEACKQGEREALGNLYKAYSGRLMRICRHYVMDENIAADILHDAFIIIFTSIKMLKDNSKLEGWMITIVRNLSLKYLQNNSKDTLPLSGIGIELPADSNAEQQNIGLDLLLSAIESLPKGNREIFKLSVLDGLSHKEIGELLGIHPHSSSSQLARAKKMLRAILINYWAWLLLPVLIPIYIYFIMRNKSDRISENKSATIDTPPTQAEHIRKPSEGIRTETYSSEAEPSAPPVSPNTNTHHSDISTKVAASIQKLPSQTPPDSIVLGQQLLSFKADTLQNKPSAGYIGQQDSLFHTPQISKERLIAQHKEINSPAKEKKKYPWTFNFGYSSNSSSDNIAHLNYLSVIDYANGGAATRIYSLGEYINYLDRNRMLMDSTENLKLRQLAINDFLSADQSVSEKTHHYHPKTYGIFLNKQLSPKWTFGTGLTYTRLKSEFENPFNTATLKRTQKIDYIGIPLQITYRLWNKQRFSAYTTTGVTFEVPIHSSLTKEFIITSDSSFTIKGKLRPQFQWSVNVGLGVQYQIIKPLSLYLEPNLFYYFKNSGRIQTYRTEHPFSFSIPFGLRLTW